MSVLTHLGEHHADVGDEAHIKHAVCFVEDDSFKLRKVENSLLHEILESTGCTDDKVMFVSQLSDLVANTGTADTNDGEEVGVLGEATKLFVDLLSELSSRDHDQNLLSRILHDFIDKRDEEGSSLTCTGVCDTNYISTIYDVRYSLVLNWSRSDVTLVLDVGFQNLFQLEVSKEVFRYENFCRLFYSDSLVYELRYIYISALKLATSRTIKSSLWSITSVRRLVTPWCV